MKKIGDANSKGWRESAPLVGIEEIIFSEKVERIILVDLKIREQIEIRDSELVKLCNEQLDAHESFLTKTLI